MEGLLLLSVGVMDAATCLARQAVEAHRQGNMPLCHREPVGTPLQLSHLHYHPRPHACSGNTGMARGPLVIPAGAAAAKRGAASQEACDACEVARGTCEALLWMLLEVLHVVEVAGRMTLVFPEVSDTACRCVIVVCDLYGL